MGEQGRGGGMMRLPRGNTAISSTDIKHLLASRASQAGPSVRAAGGRSDELLPRGNWRGRQGFSKVARCALSRGNRPVWAPRWTMGEGQ